jgi:hypothetical protein
MWLWVLDDELADFEAYAQYGLPLFKRVAVKYGFENPIGDDNGDEFQYSQEAWDSAPESHKPILRDCADALIEAADELDRRMSQLKEWTWLLR